MRRIYRRAADLAVVICCLLAFAPSGGNAQESGQPEVTASHAIVVDAATGDILLDKDANDPVAMASLTKLFTAFVALETTPLDRHMYVTDNDLVGEASMGVSAGESLTFRTLLHGMLLPSGNDAASTIARNVGAQDGDSDEQAMQRFMDRANSRLTEIGLHNTHLVNPHGLDVAGHYSTARDIAALTLYALDHEPTFRATLNTANYSAEGHAITNTNRLLGVYDGLIGGKTGVTDNAGYCLMQVAERDGRTIIVVLLGSTPEAWYDDAEALLDFGFAASLVPGSAVRYGQIGFPTDPASTTTVAPTIEGLAVTNAGNGSALVSQIDIASTPRRSPWLWIFSAAVLAPASLLTLGQLRRGASRRASLERRRRLAPMATPTTGNVIYYTEGNDWRSPQLEHNEPVNWNNVAPEYRFDETTDWRIPTARPSRRSDDNPVSFPVFSPSYSGD